MTLMKSVLSLGSAIAARQLAHSAQNVGINDMLGLIGLERKRSTLDKILPAVGWFGLGTVLGAGAALMLAPSSGKQLRSRVSEQLDQARQRVGNDLRSATEEGVVEAMRGNGA
jgi:hypothetical protein